MLKRALKLQRPHKAASALSGLEAANAQTGIETVAMVLAAEPWHDELEAANAQTGIETASWPISC